MPLSLLTNTNPIPVTMQADDPTATKQWSTKDGSGDMKTFGMDQLLEDIMVSLEKRKIDTSGMDLYEKTIAEAVNKLKGSIFDSIKTDPKYQANRNQWLIDWNNAYQNDPNQDISKLIVDKIAEMVDPKSGPYGDFVKIFRDDKTTLDEQLVKGIDAVMAALPGEVPKVKFDYSSVESTLRVEIDEFLAKFNLEEKDAATYPEVANFMSLKDDALKSLDDIFDQWDLQSPNRPYRKEFDEAKSAAKVIANFEKDSHTEEWANKLAAAAAQKAKAELGDYLAKADPSALDTRTLGVIDEFNNWAHQQKGGTVKTPPELFKSLLGDTTGQQFLDWINKWGSMLVAEHEEKISREHVTVGIKVKLRDGFTVIPAEKGAPDLKIDYGLLKTLGKETKVETVSTKSMAVTVSSYSTDALAQFYLSIVSKEKTFAKIGEDDFKEFLAKLSTPVDIALITDGQSFNGVTVAEMLKLNPNLFAGLDGYVNSAKAKAQSEPYATNPSPAWVSDLKITFNIKYLVVDGQGTIQINPIIEDKNILSIPPIKWDDTLDDKIKASDATKDKIKQLFIDADSKHEKITSPSLATISQEIVDPLYVESEAIFNALNQATEVDPKPFEVEYQGKLAVGEEVSLKFMEETYPGAKTILAPFEDASSRYKIKFTISKWDEQTRKMSVTYRITDSTIANHFTDVVNLKDNVPLAVNDIIFNKDRNKAYKILKELAGSDKGEVAGFDDKDYVDGIRTRSTPSEMTDAEFTTFFKEYDKIHDEAKALGVSLTKRKVEYNTKTGRWEQFFSASYVVGAKNIVEERAVPFTEKFLDQDEIDEALSDIKSDADKAGKAIDESEYLTDEQKSQFKDYLGNAAKGIQAAVTANGAKNVHQGIVDEAKDASGQFWGEANKAVQEAKMNMLKNKLKDFYPDGKIPDEILKLAGLYPEGMLKILKDNPSLLNNIEELKKMLEEWKINPNAAVNAAKAMQTSGKIALLSLGGLLGVGAFLGGANAVKVATTNKKAVNAKTGKIKSSKKLAVLSAFIGLASLAGSIGTMLYLFLVQGGL